MQEILISLPEHLLARMQMFIPQKQRNKVLSELLEKEIERREQALYECACEVEKDDALNQEMEDWNVTVGDNIAPEAW